MVTKGKAFDAEFAKAVFELEQRYIPGAFRWAKENRPDLFSKLEAVTKKLDTTWRLGLKSPFGLSRFKPVLEEWKKAIEEIIIAYGSHEWEVVMDEDSC